MPVIDIGFSPCPNDTFIFDALVNHKIDTKGYTFNTHLEDVQTLNEWALQGKLPVSKISYGVWPLVKNNYQVLNAGGALGKGVGPLLIYKENATSTLENSDVESGLDVKKFSENIEEYWRELFNINRYETKNKKFGFIK